MPKYLLRPNMVALICQYFLGPPFLILGKGHANLVKWSWQVTFFTMFTNLHSPPKEMQHQKSRISVEEEWSMENYELYLSVLSQLLFDGAEWLERGQQAQHTRASSSYGKQYRYKR